MNTKNTERLSKPQDKFSPEVIEAAKAEFKAWMIAYEISDHHAELLSLDLIKKSLDRLVARISNSAPDILISDRDKITSLVTGAERIASKLDHEEKLDQLIISLVEIDSNKRKEGDE
jgi:hypothetical protein